MRISVEIAPGELLDKLTILEIKAERIADPQLLRHIATERATLEQARRRHIADTREIRRLCALLKTINERLWVIEDRIRAHERAGDFGVGFIKLARAVYITNDRRFAIKRRINQLLNTDIAEAKGYVSAHQARQPVRPQPD
ncbi:MAG: hypothetical protein EA405_06535 [Rhodospirillales bacterium]|nr:MAG: hypothetical protein EA405_06535 [Rhodospirillales bacterium]